MLRARPLALAHVAERALMAFVERMDWGAALALADEALEGYAALPADDVLLLAQSCLRALCRLTEPQSLSHSHTHTQTHTHQQLGEAHNVAAQLTSLLQVLLMCC